MKEKQRIAETVLKGIGQIMLQESAWTGLLFLIAISYDSILMCAAALLSSTIGTGTARICKFSDKNINAGLYGFNATLIGIGLVFFFEASPLIWFALVLGSILSTLLMEFSIRKKIPFFTFPFIVITAGFILGLKHFDLATLNVPKATTAITSELIDFRVVAHAYGQVIFQGSLLAGLLFFLGVFVKNPTAALYGFVAALIASAVARFDQDSVQLINDGMFSFNAVLCGIACSGLKPRDGIYVFLSVIIATYFDVSMMENGWITLTFPFVLAMWVIVPLKKLVSYFENKIKNKNSNPLGV
ncbi:urea transporter [Flavobacterium granuli]|uniref:Urea transporter n=1 Tax=Flavobacterium granuli TaxID=280093 RepID=A0A1M5RZR3_9FLAO|nr:urea transporter [Flavobacterium granuli]PRZ21159.1 urea transporter [Flavobacterium granuli]SHH31709.1 urea transporter [Flavobacterium granuli]